MKTTLHRSLGVALTPSRSSPPAPSRPGAQFRVALVDQDPTVGGLVREAIRRGVGRGGGWVLETYPSTDQTLRRALSQPPDVLVLGTRSPEVPDLERIQRLHHLAPGVPVVIVTTDSEAHGVFLAVSAGVCGYLVTPVRPATLARALADAARGLPTLCQKVQRTLLTGIQAAGAGVPAGPLTAREQQILDLLFQNLRDKEIAEILRIAPGTVHVHLANLFLKLGVRGRKAAVRKFIGI